MGVYGVQWLILLYMYVYVVVVYHGLDLWYYPGFKKAAGCSRYFEHPCRRFFPPRNRKKNAIPSLDRQNQRPWNVIVNVSYQKVMQPWNSYTYRKWIGWRFKSFLNKKQQQITLNVDNYCLDSCKSSLCSSDFLYLPALFSDVVSYVINNATFEEIGQTRGSSAIPIQFSFRNQANFHWRFLCYQCVFDPIPLSALSLFSCALAFSSNLICAENQCRCCGIYHFQRPDQSNLWHASKQPCQFAVDEISMLKRKIEQSETSIQCS